MEFPSLSSIGMIQSCFREKFTIPRQSGLVPSARGIVKLADLPQMADAVRGLEGFSHIWLIYLFHQLTPVANTTGWKPLVRPPRLGGAKKIGVFASRSPHRPNPIGISALRLERIDLNALGGIELQVSGLDVLDGTPVLDIKPYIPYCDAIAEARPGWAADPLPSLDVRFTDEAARACSPALRQLITETLRLDPRPAFQAEVALGTPYAARLLDFDVHWKTEENAVLVYEIRDLRTDTSS